MMYWVFTTPSHLHHPPFTLFHLPLPAHLSLCWSSYCCPHLWYSDVPSLLKSWELFLCSDRKYSSGSIFRIQENRMLRDLSACKEDHCDLKPKARPGPAQGKDSVFQSRRTELWSVNPELGTAASKDHGLGRELQVGDVWELTVHAVYSPSLTRTPSIR